MPSSNERRGPVVETGMTDLAARCQTAEGPGRALDVGIAEFMGKVLMPWHAIAQDDGCFMRRVGDTWLEITHSKVSGMWPTDRYIPRYTASIDAALTLIPDGMWWLIGKGRTRPDEPLYGVQILDGERVVAEAETEASAALAICAAALRARAVGKDSLRTEHPQVFLAHGPDSERPPPQ